MTEQRVHAEGGELLGRLDLGGRCCRGHDDGGREAVDHDLILNVAVVFVAADDQSF